LIGFPLSAEDVLDAASLATAAVLVASTTATSRTITRRRDIENSSLK
jgi:hypothetical protein